MVLQVPIFNCQMEQLCNGGIHPCHGWKVQQQYPHILDTNICNLQWWDSSIPWVERSNIHIFQIPIFVIGIVSNLQWCGSYKFCNCSCCQLCDIAILLLFFTIIFLSFFGHRGRSPSLPRDFIVCKVALPVLRVLHCERCRIRTRDYCLRSLERCQLATTSPSLLLWQVQIFQFFLEHTIFVTEVYQFSIV